MKINKSRIGLITLAVAYLSLPVSLQAQDEPDFSEPVIEMTRIDGGGARLSLDGRLDEEIWQRVPVIDDMRVISPDTLERAPESTETRIFYDDVGIYVGVMAYQDPDTVVARMSSRDAPVPRDAFTLSIDSSGEGLYGYFLRVNVGDTLSDGTIQPEKEISREWDGHWEAYTRQLDNGWSAEIFVPWSMLALPQAEENRRQLGIYFERDVTHRNENWSWPALPSTDPEYLSGFQQFALEGISPTTEFTFYPYSSATRNNINEETDYRMGADLYWRPNANTQLSATFNPDFGTVESDDIVVNLSAFETFFSDKRSFFVEGQDVFVAHPRSGGGPFGPVTALNTRRIGAAADYDVPDGVSVDPVARNQPTDLLGAGKATGQSGNWRYGALVAAEDDSAIGGVRDDGQRVAVHADGRDFAVGRLLYEDTSRGGRRGLGWIGTRLSHPDRTATVNGVDFHYFSADTQWNVDGQVFHSDVEGTTGQGMLLDVNYRPRRGIQHTLTGNFMDRNVNLNDAGYLQRNDHYMLDYRLSETVSGLDYARTRNRSMTVINQWNSEGRPVRLGLFFGQNLTFYNNMQLNGNLRYFPPRVDDRLSRGNGTYKVPARYSGNVTWNSDRSRPVSVRLDVNSSQEDLGRRNMRYTAGLDWRPTDYFSMEGSVSYRDRKSWLIHQGGPHMASFHAVEWAPGLDMDYFISARQQFRLSMEWTGIKAHEDNHYRINQQQVDYLSRMERPEGPSRDFTVSRVSFQARYRWEFAPLSDLFVVYTRGSNIPGEFGGEFQDLLQEAWTDRIVDNLVIKLRYRLGN